MIDRVMGWKKQDVKIHLDGLVGSFKDSRTSHTKLTGKRLCFSSVIYSFIHSCIKFPINLFPIYLAIDCSIIIQFSPFSIDILTDLDFISL